MGTGAKAADYSTYSKEANRLENDVEGLLDELVNTLQRSAPSGAIEERAQLLAGEASRLAEQMQDCGPMEMNERLVALESLSGQAETLLAHLPDTVLASEHEKWSMHLEEVVNHLHQMRKSLNVLALAHVTGAVRQKHEKELKSHLSSARAKVKKAHAAIRLRQHVSAHPMHQKLTRIQAAMSSVKAHLSDVGEKHQQMLMSRAGRDAAEEMRHFFSCELNGRLYVDGHSIQLRSDLTGTTAQWPHDDVHARALEEVLSGAGMETMLENTRAHKCSMAGRFECKSDANGLMVEIEAGERTILGGNVMFRPMSGRIYV